MLVMVAMVVDMVFNPGKHWGLYSRATDTLSMAASKLAGASGAEAGLLRVLEKVEGAVTSELQDPSAIVGAAEAASSRG